MISKTEIREAARHWVVRLEAGDMSDAERAEFTDWYNTDAKHQKAFEIEHNYWKMSYVLKEAFEPSDDKKKAANVKAKANDLTLKTYNNAWLRAASIVFIIVFLGLYNFSDDLLIMANADVTTASGQRYIHILPDGSKAHLNTHSAIEVDFTENERRIELLRGEVFFEVLPDKSKPFRVVANGGSAQAVGTSYAVRKTDDEIKVTVVSGVVVVVKGEKDEAKQANSILKAGQQIRYKSKLAKNIHKVDTSKNLAWRSGKIIFDGTPFKQAIAEIDRYYPGKIIVTARINNVSHVTGVFPLNGISDAIRALADSHDLTVTETPGELLMFLH